MKDLLFKCGTVIDIVSALQVVDIIVKTIKDMRNKTDFQHHYDKAARERNVEVLEPRHRKVSQRIGRINLCYHMKKAYVLGSIMRC